MTIVFSGIDHEDEISKENHLSKEARAAEFVSKEKEMTAKDQSEQKLESSTLNAKFGKKTRDEKKEKESDKKEKSSKTTTKVFFLEMLIIFCFR